jgi:hypothetical protein
MRGSVRDQLQRGLVDLGKRRRRVPDDPVSIVVTAVQLLGAPARIEVVDRGARIGSRFWFVLAAKAERNTCDT